MWGSFWRSAEVQKEHWTFDLRISHAAHGKTCVNALKRICSLQADPSCLQCRVADQVPQASQAQAVASSRQEILGQEGEKAMRWFANAEVFSARNFAPIQFSLPSLRQDLSKGSTFTKKRFESFSQTKDISNVLREIGWEVRDGRDAQQEPARGGAVRL
jgi:hypothetical protein